MIEADATDGGIIPARAGFTPRTRRRAWCAGDHPRSRGVYFRRVIVHSWCSGSSPLARGLRAAARHPHCRVGIIPARAGFTRSSGPQDRARGDHPRSRGVYSFRMGVNDEDGGSSPLARGLHPDGRPERIEHGIIPARAGFTLTALARLRQRVGSSPLARGLPLILLAALAASGIIPARAGFTCTDTNWRSWPTDHPRSRGVYSLVRSRAGAGAGSSPLARGLLSTAPS